jgi:hypothetical protein
MYSKQEAAQLKKEFWTVFGQYMAPLISAEGEKISWINYKTGEKDIYFRMSADNKSAVISIDLLHKDPGVQEIYFEQFRQFKKLLHDTVGEEWVWQLHVMDEYGKTISRIYQTKAGLSLFRKEDWPEIISFFKPRIIALDEFWSSVKYGFEALR